MSTRAVYKFIDGDCEHSVYKHHDGMPERAAEWIKNALAYAWDLPRFEADEFAASFIAANKQAGKNKGGDLRLTTGREAHGDLEFYYEIRRHEKELTWLDVTVFRVGGYVGELTDIGHIYITDKGVIKSVLQGESEAA